MKLTIPSEHGVECCVHEKRSAIIVRTNGGDAEKRGVERKRGFDVLRAPQKVIATLGNLRHSTSCWIAYRRLSSSLGS